MQSRFVTVLAAALAPFAALAQQSGVDRVPADPNAAVPALKYESAFAVYESYREQQVAPWRDLNDEAARAGGHVGIVGGAVGQAGHGAAKPTPHPPAQGAK